MIKAFHSSLLTSPHAFFSRKGGISNGIFKGLNCSKNKGDNNQHVEVNRQNCVNYIDKKYRFKTSYNLVFGQQIHGNTALYVTKPFTENFPEADAFVTNKKNILLSVFTADCCPILLEDKNQKIIGAIHAGWKGAISGIIENTLSLMVEKGASRESIHAVLGPCLHQETFEVSHDFIAPLKKSSSFEITPFIKQIDKKYYFDLVSYIKNRLKSNHIEKISAIPFNTYKEEELFFSCRRSKHQNHAAFGTQLSCIGLHDE